jgi:polyferredoxin
MSKLKRSRVIIAIISIVSITIVFLGFEKLFDGFYDEIVLHLQFVPSFLKFIRGVSFLAIGFILFIALAFVFGRVYCSFICPLGILQDVLIRLEKRFKPKKLKFFSYSNPVPWLKHVLLAATVLAFILGSTGLLLLLDPYSNYGRIATHMIQLFFRQLIMWLPFLPIKPDGLGFITLG